MRTRFWEVSASFPPVADYALLSDCHSAALVSRAGAVEWLCMPAFDSASVFGAILDRDRGGHFSVAPPEVSSVRRRYVSGTNVLQTRFETPTGVLVMTDFLAVSPDSDAADPESLIAEHKLVRRLRCAEGSVQVVVECAPRPDYGRCVPAVEVVRESRRATFDSPDVYFALDTSHPLDPVARDGAVRAHWTLAAGEEADLVFSHVSGGSRRPAGERVAALLEEATVGYWRRWTSRLRYHGPFRGHVMRSALTLKAMVYAPTGAIIAAPTTSLPEEIGGVRNWDYRYCWLRDATFTLSAFNTLGFTDEAVRYFDWLQRVTRASGGDLQVLYGIRGRTHLPEVELTYLGGYRGSKPVRIGNGAAHQFQLDVFGEVIDSYYLFRDVLGKDRESDLRWAFRIVDQAARVWANPDEGIWEVRGGPRHFVYSKAMAWAALHRGASLARQYGGGEPEKWDAIAAQIAAQIFERGFDAARGTFVQAYDKTALDASCLRLPLIGFVDACDPKMLGTLDAVQRELTRDGLVYRYTEMDDGLAGHEGTFAICTFWLVQCLALCGRQEEAEQLFANVLRHGNDLGLFAEEIDPASGEQLGNFPQAFTHIGLINAAERLQGITVAAESSEHDRAESWPGE